MADTDHYLQLYTRKNHHKVGGWLDGDTVQQLLRIGDAQHELGVSGPVGEIGVHHGRLFILLYLLAREDEQALAVDIFEQQELNADKSGRGSLSILQANLEAYAGGTGKLQIINGDSTTVGAGDLLSRAGGKLRLFSVDGGHLAHIVRHDLNIASEALCDGGVIILDDYFNPEFPGVSEGVSQYFFSDNDRGLVPFFVGLNKIYVTTPDYAEQYMDRFTRADLGIPYSETTRFREYYGHSSPVRVTEMFGASCLSYSPDRFGARIRLKRAIKRRAMDARKRLGDSGAWARLRNTKLGTLVRKAADRVAPY